MVSLGKKLRREDEKNMSKEMADAKHRAELATIEIDAILEKHNCAMDVVQQVKVIPLRPTEKQPITKIET